MVFHIIKLWFGILCWFLHDEILNWSFQKRIYEFMKIYDDFNLYGYYCEFKSPLWLFLQSNEIYEVYMISILEIDDVYEMIWYVKGYLSYNDDGSFVINDVKSYSYDVILCGQKLKKESTFMSQNIDISYYDVYTIEVYYFFYIILWCFRVSCGIMA